MAKAGPLGGDGMHVVRLKPDITALHCSYGAQLLEVRFVETAQRGGHGSQDHLSGVNGRAG